MTPEQVKQFNELTPEQVKHIQRQEYLERLEHANHLAWKIKNECFGFITAEDRLEILALLTEHYCRECGSKKVKGRCYCKNDD
jgi:hypothetical protein